MQTTLGDRNQRYSPDQGFEMYLDRSSSGKSRFRMKASSSSLNPSTSLLPHILLRAERRKRYREEEREGRMLVGKPDGAKSGL
jgi:hypothetical protein